MTRPDFGPTFQRVFHFNLRRRHNKLNTRGPKHRARLMRLAAHLAAEKRSKLAREAFGRDAVACLVGLDEDSPLSPLVP